jgi:hypothetical protein
MTTIKRQLRLAFPEDKSAHQIASFEERKKIGDDHEKRVAYELRRRGWTVARCGMGIYPQAIVDAYTLTNSPRRWEPDLVAARGPDIIYIDAKGSREKAGHRDRRFVNVDCVRSQIHLHALGYLPIYYVFANLEVSSPYDMYSRGRFEEHSPVGSGGAYYSISVAQCRNFDLIFGRPQARPALRPVA